MFAHLTPAERRLVVRIRDHGEPLDITPDAPAWYAVADLERAGICVYAGSCRAGLSFAAASHPHLGALRAE
jgi:hypothetical protein